MNELGYLSIAEAGHALRQRHISAVELASAHLKRISQFNPGLDAFLDVAIDRALKAAEEADAAFARGDDASPLLGIPYSAKDNINVRGLLTTCHSRLPNRLPAPIDAAVVARMSESGAVLLGKNALHEFAVGGPAFDLPFPPARNPWDRDRHPGGSSSGGGAAVAAGLAMAAIGTDTMGSIRNPATCCGVVGLKPTYDLVPREGVFPLAFSLDHVGPIARSVKDCALVLDVMAGASGQQNYATELDDGVAGLTVGVLDGFHEGETVDAKVLAGFSRALDVLTDLDVELVAVSPPSLAEFQACGRVIQQAESYTVHRRWLAERPAEYCEISRRKLAVGAFLSASDYIVAQQERRALISRYREATREVDAVISLSSFTLPCRIDDPAAIAATYERHARGPFNVTGDPALSLPVGLSPGGLPLAVQLAAGPYRERILLRLARAIERALGPIVPIRAFAETRRDIRDCRPPEADRALA
ncbi:amidase [Boseaceae bacterium BT-24-1]|nr:amidase [Boseaceae bacterium BT-24-1]